MKIIGITGGIGAGKSAATSYILKKGLPVLDADEISRKITEKGGSALPEICSTFGKGVFNADGTLNRKALASIVFANKEKRNLLQRITTDKVIELIDKELEALKNEGKTVAFIDAPLLFECGVDKICDATFLVVVPYEERIARVMLRDGASREEVIRRIDAQMSDEEKKKRATEILDNSGTRENLYSQIDRLLTKYL